MNAKQSILQKITEGDFALHNAEQIAAKLRLGKKGVNAVRTILEELREEGAVLCDSRRRYGTRDQFGAVEGTLSCSERGFGFVSAEGGDLFIPRKYMNGALHGDTVLAIPFGDGDEGEIVRVLSRGYTEIVGTYRRSRKAGCLIPDERRFNAEIFIPIGKNKGCADGMKAVARILSYRGDSLTGEITETLGKSGDFFAEELSLIRANRLREEFPDEAEREAALLAARGISPNDMKGRLDLRDELIITVDGEDTRDIDDAISLSHADGVYRLGVHIADVTRYVGRGSALDREAFERGTSVYFPDRTLPMLPRALSNGICSLNEGEDRLTLSCLMTLDERGAILEKKIVPSVIRSRHRMTYGDVTAIAEGKRSALAAYPDLKEFVDDAVALTRALQAVRKARGGISLDIKEAKILYRDGKIEIPEGKRTISHEMIEAFMVAANESVAELMTARGMPFVYRIHERPSEEKAREFRDFLLGIGAEAKFSPSAVAPKDYKTVLDRFEKSSLASVVNRVMLRSMMKARYSPVNLGHFGLASECYCHFTSPIRRYPDLCIHRIIKESLTDPEAAKKHGKEEAEKTSVRASERERIAAEAEREVDALYITKYMEDKLGCEYRAVISGVTSFGLFAELKNTVEGFIPIETLPDDYYEFYENRFLLRGTKHSYRLGDRVRVKVVGTDIGLRRTKFALIGKQEGDEQ